MAHRPEDVEASQPRLPDSITVRLVDVEPFMGLTAAMGRFCTLIGPETYKTLSPEATEALSVVQGILWRLEHSNVERTD